MSERMEASGDQFWEDVDETEALQRYRSLVQAIGDGRYQLDADGRFVAVDDGIVELTGYEREDLLGESASRVLAADDAERFEREIRRRYASDDPQTDPIEVTVRTAADEPIRCEVQVTLLVDDEDGAFRGSVGIVREVTDRKRTAIEERLRERERQLSTLMDNVPGMVYRCRNERGWPMEFVSDACRDVTGYDPAVLERGEVEYGTDVVHEADRDALWASIQREVDDREPFSETYRIETADGETRWVRDYGRGVFDDDGDLVGLEGIVADVTERKRLETELEEVFGRVTDAFYALDDQWQFTHVNERAAELIDYTGEGLVGRTIWEVFEWGADSKLREEYERAMETQEATSFELYYPDPLETWFEVNAYPSETGLSVYFRDVTERKTRERKLEESERRYRTLVEHFPNGAVALVDEDLHYRTVGGDPTQTADATIDEVEGRPVREALPPELAEKLVPCYEAALNGESSTFEAESNGGIYQFQVVPVRDNDGDVFAAIGTSQDVTERKRMERRLRESEAKFRLLAENLEEVVWMSTPDTEEMLYVNPAYEDVWGHDRTELENDPHAFIDRVHPADRERVREAYTALPEAEYDEEFRIVRPDGEIRWIHARATRVRDEDGGVTRIVGIAEDVTERVERERALEESEQRYRTLAEHFPNGAVGVYDRDLRYTLAEGAVLGGRLPPADRIEGSRMPEVFPGETAADVEPVFEAAIEDGETGSVETTFGGRHWRVWATPLRNADGEIFAGLSFTQDVTEQVERERKLERVIDQLEASNERLEQFAYAASHDLQEPLRMVASYLQLIERRYEDELDEDGREFLEYAVDGAERMRAMIDALLEYSRIETRGDPFEPVALEDVLDEALQDLQVKIAESDATITAGSLPQVEGDASQLRQVFQNLLDNAIEYSGDEPPRIRVSADRDGREVVVSVRDEGIGIAAADQDRIFEVFNRLHTHDEHAGAGIGLALCERIVERHGGEMWVDSEPGEGTTVSFTLPTADTGT